MEEKNRTYIAIDLKSFYASVECISRGLDPLTTNLVVADQSRTEKTICLSVTPSLKAMGVPARARLFEVIQKIKEINAERKYLAPSHILSDFSCDAKALAADPSLAVDYIVAPPQMAEYIRQSSRIYEIYMRFVAPCDIHIYSIDEVFMDVTSYLKTGKISAHDFAMKIILEVLRETGITATAGIGTNLYLAKVAMDIKAKHIPPDENGVRIAELDETSYRKQLWNHRPLTDFWRVGKGYSKKLEANHLFTMGDIARCSVGDEKSYFNEELLYRLFGINAELLIDHAWGWESCTMADIKAYQPQVNCISSGQVLQDAYPFEKARIVCKEMADSLAMDLFFKKLVTDQIVLTVGYDGESLFDPEIRKACKGRIKTDAYGRAIPQHAHGTVNLSTYTASAREIIDRTTELFDRIVDPTLLIRRLTIVAGRVIRKSDAPEKAAFQQLDLFTDYAEEEKKKKAAEKEEHLQQAVLSIKQKYGKNAILRGMNFEEGATAIDRNRQIGGHRA